MTENAYFDNAATTWPKPELVYTLMDRFARDIGVNAGRGSHALAADAESLVRQTRSMLGAFVGYAGPAERVIFASNGTDALNTAISGLVPDGAHVVTTSLEHNAVARVLNHAVKERSLLTSVARSDPAGYVSAGAIAEALRDDTRALIVNHASNVVGTVQPLDEIAALARRAGVPIILDAAQTVGVVPIDMDQRGLAVVAFAGHKGLFGPMGSAALVVAEGVELQPKRFGGTGVDSASPLQPHPLPWRLEPGTLGMPAIAGLHAAQLWFRSLGEHLLAGSDAHEWQPPQYANMDQALDAAESVPRAEHAMACERAIRHVHAVELRHIQAIEQMLDRSRGVRVLGGARDRDRVATLSLVHDQMDSQQMADRLDADHHVCCRAGLQCAPWAHETMGTHESGGSVRLSPGYFTTESDLARLAAGLADVFGD